MYNKANEILDLNRVNLIFPYHINHELRQSDYFYNEKYDSFHAHDFYELVVRASEEPNAFYLTDEDKTYYSNQELTIIETIIKKGK